jgi:DNA-binding HxlR family transcriptional regulator
MVKRTVYPTIPPRVDYELTPLGRNLLGPVTELAIWAQRHRAQIQRARDAFAARNTRPERGA